MIKQGTLTPESLESEVFKIQGEATILIQGEGTVSLLRSVGDSEFLPITDAAGEEVTFYGDSLESVMFNGEYRNSSGVCRFKLVADTATEVKYHVAIGC